MRTRSEPPASWMPPRVAAPTVIGLGGVLTFAGDPGLPTFGGMVGAGTTPPRGRTSMILESIRISSPRE